MCIDGILKRYTAESLSPYLIILHLHAAIPIVEMEEPVTHPKAMAPEQEADDVFLRKGHVPDGR